MEKTEVAPGIWTIDNVLTPQECAEYIALAEDMGFGDAPITRAGGSESIAPEVRNNTRVILDDVERAAELWARVSAEAPPFLQGRQAIGLNERLRFYRYEPGQKFRFHQDGAFERENGEKSLLTFMIYLNHDFWGGETKFTGTVVAPLTGRALLFRHDLLHEGTTVVEGRKYVLRSDVMFGPVGRLYSR